FLATGQKIEPGSNGFFSKSFPGFSRPNSRENKVSPTSETNHALKDFGFQHDDTESHQSYMGEISQDKSRHQAPFTSCVYGTRIIVPRPSSHYECRGTCLRATRGIN